MSENFECGALTYCSAKKVMPATSPAPPFLFYCQLLSGRGRVGICVSIRICISVRRLLSCYTCIQLILNSSAHFTQLEEVFASGIRFVSQAGCFRFVPVHFSKTRCLDKHTCTVGPGRFKRLYLFLDRPKFSVRAPLNVHAAGVFDLLRLKRESLFGVLHSLLNARTHSLEVLGILRLDVLINVLAVALDLFAVGIGTGYLIRTGVLPGGERGVRFGPVMGLNAFVRCSISYPLQPVIVSLKVIVEACDRLVRTLFIRVDGEHLLIFRDSRLSQICPIPASDELRMNGARQK